jgi:hypothetical protein
MAGRAGCPNAVHGLMYHCNSPEVSLLFFKHCLASATNARMRHASGFECVLASVSGSCKCTKKRCRYGLSELIPHTIAEPVYAAG